MENIIVAIENDLLTLSILLSIHLSLILINTMLSSISAWNFGDWNSKKFWTGIIKNILIAVCMILFFLVLEVLPFALQRTGIIIPNDLISILEVLGMIVVCIVKYVKDIYKQFMNLLGVTEEEVKAYTGAQE